MHEELAKLGADLCRPGRTAAGPPADLSTAIGRAVVALPAGGFGYRMRGVTAEPGAVTQKSLLPLPNGETLAGRLVRQYAEAGFRQFVALVNYEGQEVEAHLGDGSRWGVEIRFSYDPDSKGSGRTGAMLHAMNAGVLPEDRTVVVHNADCHVMRYPGCFPHDLLAAHLHAVAEGNPVATLAAVDGTPYPFTGMSVRAGMVTEVAMYPFIPVPTHTGITVLTAEALAVIRGNAARSQKNFEADLFPCWASEGRLAAMVISHHNWVAVDDRKAYRVFCQVVQEEG
jgi:NDP-sugar pyrophosphorylase family protein